MIFLDLDNTLVHSVDYPQHGEDIVPIALSEWTYYCKRRKFPLDFLAACRNIATTSLLTNATREYALAHNKALDLGFSDSEIFAREDYLYQSPVAYGTQTFLAAIEKFPTAILIDNLPSSDPLAKSKQRFLGIPEAQYLQIREYHGRDDPPAFEEEILTLLETLHLHFQKK